MKSKPVRVSITQWQYEADSPRWFYSALHMQCGVLFKNSFVYNSIGVKELKRSPDTTVFQSGPPAQTPPPRSSSSSDTLPSLLLVTVTQWQQEQQSHRMRWVWFVLYSLMSSHRCLTVQLLMAPPRALTAGQHRRLFLLSELQASMCSLVGLSESLC